MQEVSKNHQAGYVSIIGQPNAGKSTFLNAVLGQKLAATNEKAQTTRRKILGILNHEEYQIVLTDTPGILDPAYELQKFMMKTVLSSFQDADVILLMDDLKAERPLHESMIERLKKAEQPLIIAVNKIDISNPQYLKERLNYWENTLPDAQVFGISALSKFGINELITQIKKILPVSPPFFPKDQITDLPERFFVNETIRSKALVYYKNEIPYSIEVQTEEFLDEPEILKIHSVIYVERESQRGIIIGHKGHALKRLGTAARKELTTFFGKKIFLNLHVKVNKNWRNDERQLRKFGYDH
ncbi:MAG: GTPase Era [Psychroflexus sp.]|nr:GTPase Era [Psychroflexus sp.]